MLRKISYLSLMILIGIIAILVLYTVTAHVVHAQGAAPGFVPLADVSVSSKLGQPYSSSTDLSSFINGLFKFALALGAILAVLRLTYAGYLYMGQSDMWSHKGEARAIIGDVVLGILLLLGIYIILNQINPDILTLKALSNIQKLPQQTQAPSTQSAPSSQDIINQYTSPNYNGSGVNPFTNGGGALP